MGLGPPMLSLFKFMHDQGLFKTIRSVAEIGSQEYDTQLPEYDALLTRFLEAEGADVPGSRDPESGRLKAPARELFKRLGCDYISFDIDGRFGSIPFDFNFDQLAPEHRHWSTLTTNLGTTEHVFNQFSCFKLMHDLTQPGGYMVHALPLHNYINHGLFSYSPCFFEALAAANEYEIFGIWMAARPYQNLLPPARPPFPPRRTLILVLLRRTNPDEFIVPLQLSNPMLVHNTMGDRYKVTERHRRTAAWNVNVRYDGLIKVDLDANTSSLLTEYEDELSLVLQRKPRASVKKAKAREPATSEAVVGVAKEDALPRANPSASPGAGSTNLSTRVFRQIRLLVNLGASNSSGDRQ